MEIIKIPVSFGGWIEAVALMGPILPNILTRHYP